jgi:two-component system, NtrC family, nitrogen regulation sensor histidine kinase NtrY
MSAGTRAGTQDVATGAASPGTRRWRRRPLSYDEQILLWAVLVGLPGTVAAVALVWLVEVPASLRWGLSVFLLLAWPAAAFALRERVIRPLRTIAALLGGLQEGDYSIRGRLAGGGGSLEDVFREINALVETLREERLGAVEASALLRTVMGEIDVAIFAFDGNQRVQLVNRAGERLLRQPAPELIGRTAAELQLDAFLAGDVARTVERAFPGATGRWSARRNTFREQGRPHQLLVLADLSRELRAEERQAWQRLVRVLGHELNNSLAPIKSIAGSLQRLAQRDPAPDDWQDDMKRGLEVIGSRAEALNRFMSAYAQLARLPKPRLQDVHLPALFRRVAGLETRLQITVTPGPELTIRADGDQLEQLLINLARNAVDATLEGETGETPTSGGAGVRMRWQQDGAWLDLEVEDDGPGLSNTANLFVPFFTTKPGGNGIGLVLCRQIAEAHGGSLRLENRGNGSGCVAQLRLPANHEPGATSM